MQFNPISLGAAPLVAAALGRALGVKVEVSRHVNTAMTNGKKIMLPDLPIDLDDDTSRLLWGFIHHEAGHCRHTEFEVFADPDVSADAFLRNLLNALEDIRMERAHMAIYPGSVRILSDMVRTLVDIGFFGPPPPDTSDANAFHAFVLTELRSKLLGQTALSDSAEAARRLLVSSFGDGFVTRLRGHMNQIVDAESTADVYALAVRIRDFIKEEIDKCKEQPDSSDENDGQQASDQSDQSGTSHSDAGSDDSADDSGSTSDSSQEEDGEGSDGSAGSQTGSDEDAESDDAADDSGSTSDSSQEEGGEGSDDSADSQTASDDAQSSAGDPVKSMQEILAGDDIDKSLGDLGDAMSDLLSDGIKDSPSRRIGIPKAYPRNAGYRDNDAIIHARAVSTKLAVRLKRQLESVGAVISHPSYRGKRISRRHLAKVRHGDFRVFRHREVLPTTNTAVVSLIDVSSSMRGESAELASRAILATALALRTISNIEHCVGAFPGPTGNDSLELIQGFSDLPESISSRYSLQARGFTPMSEALLWAFDRLAPRTEARRIIFVATDGRPDDAQSAKQILAHAKRLNLEVHGLGIKTDDYYGLFDSFVTVETLNELPESFISLFQRVLRRSA